MKKYIEEGEKKAGNLAELAKLLEIKANYLSMVKGNKRGLPDATCIQLAEYINEDAIHVIAASNLITEKDERKRKIFESCFKEVASVASIALVTSMLTLPAAKPVNAENLTYQTEKNTNYQQLVI